MAKVLPEERVVADWLRRIENGGRFLTDNDGPVTLLDPGRRNDDHGADFTDALLATRRGLVIGDIEVHTRSSGWWSHRHDADPAYNRVVLHVVDFDDAGRDAVLANGRTVPTVVLEAPARLDPPVLPDTSRCLPCATFLRPPEEISAVLDELGLARFEERVRSIQEAFERDGPDQALCAGLGTALGYRHNREPMACLAASLPLQELERFLVTCGNNRLAATEGLLIGAAGLLPSQRTRRAGGISAPKPIERLEAAWRAFGSPSYLSESDWHHARVRPGNYPVRRLAALARLLVRYRRGGLAEGLLAGLAPAKNPRDMAALVAVPAAGLWREHLDFGMPALGKAPALCGAGRAADIVVNVLLPFAAVWHDRNGYAAAKRAARTAWQDHPPLADNMILEEVRRRLGLPRPATALRQQGMLRLQKQYCVTGNCRACPIVS